MKTFSVRCAGSYAGSHHACVITIGPNEWEFGMDEIEYDRDAQVLCDALRGSLPGAVLDRLLDKMNKARAADEERWSAHARSVR